MSLPAHQGKCVVVKTSTRQTVFLPVIGLVDAAELTPGDLVGVNKDSYLILDKLPAAYDSRVKAMEVDEKPTEDYSMVGGLDKQIEELIEAVVLPITHKERFAALGIKPPKGVLMFGPPGTGKTLMARACAARTEATFLKISAPQLVQMYIGDGAKMVRDAFALAREKAPTIIFIDELDAIGTKRFDSDKSGDREVQRTMLELLNQLDGFSSDDKIKVICATNRPDILDPALLRSGRIDRKIEFPLPDEAARARIIQIHARKMNCSKGASGAPVLFFVFNVNFASKLAVLLSLVIFLSIYLSLLSSLSLSCIPWSVPPSALHPLRAPSDVNYEELARCTEDFNGAQLKAIGVEAGMLALRRGAVELQHEDFMEGINQVQSKKKASLAYYA